MKKIVLILVVLLMAISIFGCSSAPPSTSAPSVTVPSASSSSPETSPATSATPIKIGAIMSLTGESALSGAGQKAELKYRLDQIGNQVAGRPIQLFIEDDASSPTTGVDAIKKLLLLNKVDVVLGPTQGGAAMAVGNYMKTATPAVPTFIIMSKSGTLLQNAPNNNIYLPSGTDRASGYYLGLYAADKLKYKTADLLWEDMISGEDKVKNGFLAGFKKEGGSAVQEQVIKPNTIDFSANIAALKPADCVVWWFTPGMANRFPAQYIASGKTMPLLIPDSTVLLSRTLTQIGNKAAGIISETYYTSLSDTPMNQAYVTDYQKKMGAIPQPQAACLDEALLVYLAAVKATNEDTSPAVINDAIHKIKLDTPAGTISFTPKGMGIGNEYIAESVKLPDRIDWKPIDTYSQVVLDVPGEPGS